MMRAVAVVEHRRESRYHLTRERSGATIGRRSQCALRRPRRDVFSRQGCSLHERRFDAGSTASAGQGAVTCATVATARAKDRRVLVRMATIQDHRVEPDVSAQRPERNRPALLSGERAVNAGRTGPVKFGQRSSTARRARRPRRRCRRPPRRSFVVTHGLPGPTVDRDRSFEAGAVDPSFGVPPAGVGRSFRRKSRWVQRSCRLGRTSGRPDPGARGVEGARG